MNTIKANSLEGIRAALVAHAPHLVSTIDELISGGLADGPGGLPGDSMSGMLTATISWELGEPVLQALESIGHRFGSDLLFAGRPLSLLVSSWRHFASPRQLPPQQ